MNLHMVGNFAWELTDPLLFIIRVKREFVVGSPCPALRAVVYLQQIKKKAKAEGKTCHTKTMLSLEKPIKLL